MTLFHAMICNDGVVSFDVIIRYVIYRYAVLCRVVYPMCCCFMLNTICMLYYDMLCYVILCYVMLYYVTYAMLC